VVAPMGLCLSGGDLRVCVTRNLSATGALVATAEPLRVGQQVVLAYRPSGLDGRRVRVRGTVVRAEALPRAASAFRYRGAVRFDTPLARVPFTGAIDVVRA